MAELEGIKELYRRLDAISEPEARRNIIGLIALAAVGFAKEELEPHRQTGNLSRTIRLGEVSADEATILAGGIDGVGYARHVEFGTRPHKIRPRRARRLAWPRNAGDRRLTGTARTGTTDFIFAMEVDHPGTKEVRYLRRGVERAADVAGLTATIVKAWNDAA